MNSLIKRRRFLQFSCSVGAALIIPRAQACEFFASTLRVVRPWTRASAPGATSAIVCMEFDNVTMDDRLIGVSTPIAANAQMGGVEPAPGVNFAIPRGAKSVLSETGVHIRLLDLKHPLEMGREYPLTLTFECGGVVAADVDVDYAYFG